MTPATTFAGRRVALFGLGGSGLATALALKAGGAEVLAGDDSAASRAGAEAVGIETTADLAGADWRGVAALLLSPGVPLTYKEGRPYTHPVVARAREAGAEVIGDIELFCRERAKIAPGSPFIAITGTNGKSTTTALVSHILREAGLDVQMGGNIGTPILQLEAPAKDRVHVVEMSSFQIDLTPSLGPVHSDAPHAEVRGEAEPRSSQDGPASFEAPLRGAPQDEGVGGTGVAGPTVGVLLNITPDHLDRHGSMKAYAAIKERVVASAGCAVIGTDDAPSLAIFEWRRKSGPERVLFVSQTARPGHGVGFCGTEIEAGLPGLATSRFTLAGNGALRGVHNTQNAAAAVAVALTFGLAPDGVQAALATFPGLPHRMEEVGRRGHVLFVNDSKATNADSTQKALLAFERVHWVLGGVAKEGGIEPLRPLFTKVDKAYLIGEAAEPFAATLGDAVPFARCGTLERALAEAAADAARSDAKEPVVLLSPACASYDQYPNFEKRGDHFRALVAALPGIEAKG